MSETVQDDVTDLVTEPKPEPQTKPKRRSSKAEQVAFIRSFAMARAIHRVPGEAVQEANQAWSRISADGITPKEQAFLAEYMIQAALFPAGLTGMLRQGRELYRLLEV